MKHLKSWFAPLAVAAMIVPSVALAQGSVTPGQNPFQTAQGQVQDVGAAAGVNNTASLSQIIGNIINIALGFLGIVFLVLLLYAGFEWMTAQGDEAKVKKARGMISQAVIGLIIIVAAFAISNFVLSSLVNVTQQ